MWTSCSEFLGRCWLGQCWLSRGNWSNTQRHLDQWAYASVAIARPDLLQDMEKKIFWQNLTPKERQAFQSREAKRRTQVSQFLKMFKMDPTMVTDTTTQSCWNRLCCRYGVFTGAWKTIQAQKEEDQGATCFLFSLHHWYWHSTTETSYRWGGIRRQRCAIDQTGWFEVKEVLCETKWKVEWQWGNWLVISFSMMWLIATKSAHQTESEGSQT